MTRVALGPGREFDRIRAIARQLTSGAELLGDDCAVLAWPDGTLVASTDASVEGVHFRREWLSWDEIGWRAAAGALSDLAAEGATAVGLLAAVGVPSDASDDDVTSVMAGVDAAARAVGGRIVGGDLTASPVWSATVTVLGTARQAVARAGAQAGDGIWVTGALGAARAALDAFRAGVEPDAAARAAFAHPEPRLAAGRWLAAHGARAMIDLSDGLAGDAVHLAAASGVAIEIDLDRLPVAAPVATQAERVGVPPTQYAAEGGEDYELLAALPEPFGTSEQDEFRRACGLALTRVGTVRPGAGVRFMLAGREVTLEGFNHFR